MIQLRYKQGYIHNIIVQCTNQTFAMNIKCYKCVELPPQCLLCLYFHCCVTCLALVFSCQYTSTVHSDIILFSIQSSPLLSGCRILPGLAVGKQQRCCCSDVMDFSLTHKTTSLKSSSMQGVACLSCHSNQVDAIDKQMALTGNRKKDSFHK